MHRYSSDGLHLTEQFEADGGPRLIAYSDSKGIWTIAYGHTRGVVPGMTCDRSQAEQWLAEDIAWAESEVNKLVHVPLTQGEFDGLVDFVFNCGVGNFEHSTLLKLVNAGDMEHAADEFEKWDHCGGEAVAGLLRRRKTEESEFVNS